MKCNCDMIFVGKGRKTREAQKNGTSVLSEYRIWQGIRERCKPHARKFLKYYTGRVKISTNWNETFQNFYRDLGDRPSKDHSVDRIDGNKGYCKHNCRWATSYEQVINRRNIKYTGTSLGVRKRGKYYVARIVILGRMFQLGSFETQKQADQTYRKYKKFVSGVNGRSLKQQPKQRGQNGKARI